MSNHEKSAGVILINGTTTTKKNGFLKILIQ